LPVNHGVITSMYYRDPDKNRVELQEAGEAMADLLCIPPLPQGENTWDMRVPGPPAGRPAGGRAKRSRRTADACWAGLTSIDRSIDYLD
jgi:hypothetical protein